jgi:hypothetical protein
MLGAIVGGIVGAGLFAFILYTGWQRTLRRWRATEDALQRAAQVVVGFLSNLGLLVFLVASGAAVGTFLDCTQNNQLLLTLALVGAGLFVGSFVLSFFLALFITGVGASKPAESKRGHAKRKRKTRRS